MPIQYQYKPRQDEEFRDVIWQEYYKRKAMNSCMRCGEYEQYTIVEEKRPIYIEFYDKTDLYRVDFRIVTKHIENKNNLDLPGVSLLCKACRDHVTGKKPYPLNCNPDDASNELEFRREKERNRRFHQQDAINNAKAAARKIRQERGLRQEDETRI